MNKDAHLFFDKAQSLLNKGDVIQAEKIMLDLLSKYPNVIEFNYFLGLVFVHGGKFKNSIEVLNKVTKQKKNYELVFLLLGISYAGLKDFKNGLKNFQKAIQFNPFKIEPYLNITNLFIEIKDYASANYYLNKAEDLEPNNIKLYELKGILSLKEKNFDDAIQNFEYIVSEHTNDSNAYFNLANAYREKLQIEKSIDCFKKTILINPKNSIFFIELSKTLYESGKALEAYEVLKNNYRNFTNQEQLNFLELLALISSENNLIDESIKYHEEFLNSHHVNSIFMTILWNYSQLKTLSFDSEIFKKAEQIQQREKLDDDQRSFFEFVVAKIHKNLGEKDLYVDHLNKANSLLKKHRKYSYEIDKKRIKKIFEFNSKLDQFDIESESKVNPIFIVGMPRSGTTLIEQIISSHNDVFGCGEIHLLSDELNDLSLKIDLKSIKEKYENFVLLKKQKKKFHTDKYPLNFLYLNLIFKIFPNAKIINVQRSRVATILSIYDKWMGNKFGFGSDLKDLKLFYDDYEKIMKFWNKTYPGKIYNLSYESLTINSAEEIKQLIDFVELDWDENCLLPHKNNRLVNTPSKFQVRKKIYKNSSSSWNEYIKFFPEINE